MKKSQFATPAGVDHDYNYLKGVEQSIDKAGRDAFDRGIGRSSAANKNVAKRDRAENPLQKYLIENSITVQHAPTGMSRQKTNQTRATLRHRIMWTVEWCDSASSKHLQDDCLESDTISHLHDVAQTQIRNVQKRKLSATNSSNFKQPGKKRKRPLQSADSLLKTLDFERNRQAFDEQLLAHEATTTGTAQITNSDQISTGYSISEEGVETTTLVGSNDPEQAERLMSAADNANDAHHADDSAQQTVLNPTDSGPGRHYYLLKPAAASTSKVLIPVEAKSALTTCLKHRVVLEYPTIYVLEKPPNSLPEGFQLEKDYLMAKRAEDAELEKMTRAVNAVSGQSKTLSTQRQEQHEVLDSRSILDMLKRDVRM